MVSGRGVDAFTYHGGNLAEARRRFSRAPEPWIDLSTGINGEAYPFPPLDPAAFERLPERDARLRLEAAAAAAYGCDPACVVAAPGTDALIGWLPRLFPVATAGILETSYAEHARAWRRAGAAVETVTEPARLAGFDAAVVVNPNNPDGRVLACDDLAGIAVELSRRDGLLVLDEAFMDLLPPRASLAPRLPARRTVVLRSFGKTFGLAGLRLGFALASADIVGIIRDAFGPWPVSGPAIAIGERALGDRAWLDATRTRLASAAATLDALLERGGAEIVGGTPLFRLARFAPGSRTFERLAEAGILTRPFANRPGLLRFGVPTRAEQFDRLARALA